MTDTITRTERPEGELSKPVKTRRTNLGGKPFSRRNPLPIGAIGLALIAALLWAAFNVDKLPLIGGGTTYSAYFSDAAGLRSGDEVRIAGLKVGSVDSVDLDGNKVKVTFKVKNAYVGNESTAEIKIKTLLGAKYLGLDSVGNGKQDPSHTIPLTRTTTPFDIYPAFTQLTNTVDQIDTKQLAQAFTVLSNDFKDTPESVRSVVTGLTRLSTTISSRDQALRTLLAKANQVTGVLAARDADLQQLLNDGGLLLDELNARRDAIHSLLVNTSVLAAQLQGLVQDNQKTLGPLLDQLHGVLTLLQNNQDALDRDLSLIGPFYRLFNNVVGNGRWFDNYIQNFSVTGMLGLVARGGGLI
jgi:phospholipid/cholesterol/gamma-HCH transport system substrate-binding protein